MLYPGIGIITPARPFPSVIPVEIIPIMTCVAKQTIIFSVTTRFTQVSWCLLIFVFLSQLCSPLYTNIQNISHFVSNMKLVMMMMILRMMMERTSN